MTSQIPLLDPADEALFQLAKAARDQGYNFTTITPLTHQRVNERPGNQWARNLQDVFGWSRPFLSGVLPPPIVEFMERAQVIAPYGEGWRSLVRLSSLGDQLFLHSAFPTGEADAIFFGPDTYRFATAIEIYLSGRPDAPRRVVDIGCGAGPGAILVALAHPDARVQAIDINHRALRFTRINALLAGADNVEPCHSNLLTEVQGTFDLIVSNPPYLVDPSERVYRHGGGPLGAGLSLAIVDAALERLAPAGTLLLYTGTAIVKGVDPFRAAIEKRLAHLEVTWSYREVDPDVFGEELLNAVYAEADRIAAVVLTVTKSGRK